MMATKGVLPPSFQPRIFNFSLTLSFLRPLGGWALTLWKSNYKEGHVRS